MVVQFFLLQENVQYERVAGIADTVQRELGMLPQQANLRRLPAFSKAVHKNFGKNILMRYKRMNII